MGLTTTYDANGNLTALGSTTYTWNARNQLTATSAGSSTFAYDALGRRISAVVAGTTTGYQYDGLNPVMLGGNFMLAGLGLDEYYARVTSGTATSLLPDALGSTVAMSSSTATTTASYAYSPYGDTVKTGTDATPLEYTGRENDGTTGLYYYRARYYSPALGRFVSEDPIGLKGGLNRYAYVRGKGKVRPSVFPKRRRGARSPKRWRVKPSDEERVSVLDCGGLTPLSGEDLTRKQKRTRFVEKCGNGIKPLQAAHLTSHQFYWW